MMRQAHRLRGLAGLLLLAGCTVGPKYHRPAAPMPALFKEATPADYRTAGDWVRAQPDDAAARGAWWRLFGDPTLDQLEDQLASANQSLKLADARFREARAMVGYQRAAEFPTITVGATTASVQDSLHQPYFELPHSPSEGELELPFDLNYEVDLWGRIRHTVAAAREEAQASAADLASVRLSLHADLAYDYIELRSADAEQKLLDDTVKAYTEALQLAQKRLSGGYAPISDLVQAQTQLEAARVADTDIAVQRAQYEHAIAVLIGQPPSAFTLPPALPDLRQPNIPPGLPSTLLQRRPDIAAAERRMAEGNDQIGIARAAYYPSLNFAALAGFEGTNPANWFGWPSLFWAVGTTLAQPLFDGGRIHAQSEAAEASYEADVAAYRQTVLTAFQQVEDNLAALRILGLEAQQQAAAVASADRGVQIYVTRYKAGEDPYLQVITAQTTALVNQRNQVDIDRRRMEATVLLIKALGGGWNVANLPRSFEPGLPRGAVVPLDLP